MRQTLFAITTWALMLFCIQAQGKERCTPIYIFGTSASFNDSVVFITEIQIVDSAWVEEKTGFLVKRAEYSNQLRNHFNSRGYSTRTCLVSFATKEKDILKKYAKMRKKFEGTKKHPKHHDIRIIDEEEFKFISECTDNIGEALTIDEKATKRAEKSKEKKKRGTLETQRRSGSDNPNLPPAMPPRH